MKVEAKLEGQTKVVLEITLEDLDDVRQSLIDGSWVDAVILDEYRDLIEATVYRRMFTE